MKTIDFHDYLVNNALKELEKELKKNTVLRLITGYGSTSNTSKVRNAIIRYLDKLNLIYFVGSELSINDKFNSLNILIQNELKKYLLENNPGIIYVVCNK